jgi:hypothetical protein
MLFGPPETFSLLGGVAKAGSIFELVLEILPTRPC